MHRNQWLRLLLATSILAVANSSMPAWCQSSQLPEAAPSLPSGTVPGIEFTKMQDLDPNAHGKNRLIKQKWAVVIGTSKFKEGRLSPVGTGDMSQSAKDFFEYLIDPHGGRFDRSHVKLLLDSGASRQSIMTALGPSFLGNAVGPDDLVVVFVATSAFPTTDGGTYLCAYDCALDNIFGTCISMQSLMTTLKQNVHSDRIVLVLQAAYSGAAELESGAKSLTPSHSYNVDLDKVLLGSGFVILSSSQPNEMTWSSAFSKNLTSALRQEDGLITLEKAFAIARKKTEAETAAVDAKKRQIPEMKSSWTGADLVLGAPPAERVANLPASVNSFLSAEGCYLKASNLIAAGKEDEALAQYKLAIAADPKYADALADYGAALTMKDDWKTAADMYKRAIAVQPNDELFHLNYARILDKFGDAEGSLGELNTAYKLNPKDMSVLKALAGRSLASGQAGAAVRYYEEAVDLYPASSDLRERLSYALMKSHDVNEASAQAKEAVRLDPKSVSAHTTLGTVLLVRGYVVPAVQAYKDAAKLAPNDADVLWLLSNAEEKAGDRAGAIAELEHFLQLCAPSDPRVAKGQGHLAELKARN